MTTTQAHHDSSGWTPDDSTFGARLALIRQRMRWGNVKEAAVACGLPTESWRSWERDNRAPRNVVEIAAIIADRTGCDYGWLLTGPRLREGRLITSAGATNGRSGHATGQLRQRSSRTITKRHAPPAHPIGRPETSAATPIPTGPPTQRRATLVTHRPGN